MPDYIDPAYQTYTPSGVVDSIDGNTAKKGAMSALTNLIPAPQTVGLYVPRAAAYALTNCPGFTTPGYVSCMKQVGNNIVGMLASGLNAGFDQPFVYSLTSGTFLAISGILSTNVPTSPPTSGAWTPPTIDGVGGWVVFTHPGFAGPSGSNGTYGWLDMTGFSLNSLTGDTHSTTTVDTLSTNPLIAGVTVGMTISSSAGDIPAGTTVVGVTASTVTLSKAATGSNGVTLTISGGTQTAPLWASGNTNTNPLPSTPTDVVIFTDRAYFSCGNVKYYTDVLNPLNMTNATNSLTLGGDDPIIVSSGQPFFTTQSGGIIASLLCFKKAQIWQITGDLVGGQSSSGSFSTLALNKLSDGVGTLGPRSVVNTPLGVMFNASDGIRTVDLTGNVNPPNPDLSLPFQNVIVPSRVAAAYNVGFYRICTSSLVGGSTKTVEYWLNTNTNNWCGPHTLTYDCIVGTSSTFLVSGPGYAGQILQTSVLPNELTDFFQELGQNLTFTYRTVLIPEFRAMPGWSLEEASIFLENDQQQTLTCNMLDQTGTVLSSYALMTPFIAPSNGTNWSMFFTDSTTSGNSVSIQTRFSFQITGESANNLGLGSIFAHYQYQDNNNAFDAATFTIPSSIDFGLVSDSNIYSEMDWGQVTDMANSSVDFETLGTFPGNP